MNVYEYELAGLADTIHYEPVRNNRDDSEKIEWDDVFTTVSDPDEERRFAPAGSCGASH